MKQTEDINIEQLVLPGFVQENEAELMMHDADTLRNLYALTGPARKTYLILLGEANAIRIRTVAEAQADAIKALRKAEAEGYKMIDAVLADARYPELILEMAKLHTMHRVMQSLADGKATKLFLPLDFNQLLSFVSAATQVATPDRAGGSGGE